MGSLGDRDVTYSVLERQGSNFEPCVWRRLCHLIHLTKEVILAQFSIHAHRWPKAPSIHSQAIKFNPSSAGQSLDVRI